MSNKFSLISIDMQGFTLKSVQNENSFICYFH
jgi:hypothetical protein